MNTVREALVRVMPPTTEAEHCDLHINECEVAA